MYNRVVLVGRLTRDPKVQYSSNVENAMAIARYTLAVDRRPSKNNKEPGADFISVVAFGRDGEFAEKYLRKGTKILVEGRIQTGEYTNKEGQTVYTTDVVAERHVFVDSKGSSNNGGQATVAETAPASSNDAGDGFMNIPDGIDEELPFS